MSEEKRTIDSVMADLSQLVADKKPISPTQWIDAGLFINTMMGELDTLYLTAEVDLANAKLKLLAEDKSVAAVEIEIKVTPEYLVWREIDLKKKRLEEQIRLCKRRAKVEETF